MTTTGKGSSSLAFPGETAYEWHDGSTVYQRACDACDKGLLYAPARFCPKCSGSGFLLRHPATKGSTEPPPDNTWAKTASARKDRP